MAAVELSYDRDWIRYRVSTFYTSGDANPRDGRARGFDSIEDLPNFAGGLFSFWNREGIPPDRLGRVNQVARQLGSRCARQPRGRPG